MKLYADDIRLMGADAFVREVLTAAENWIHDHDAQAGDVLAAFEERLEALGLAHLRHAADCHYIENDGDCTATTCRWEPAQVQSTGMITPESLAMEIYDFCQKSGLVGVDASIKTLEFLTESLGFAISASTGGDDALRLKTQQMLADMILKMQRHPATWAPAPEITS